MNATDRDRKYLESLMRETDITDKSPSVGFVSSPQRDSQSNSMPTSAGSPPHGPIPGFDEAASSEARAERAAIMEYDAGLPRAEAERQAGLMAPDGARPSVLDRVRKKFGSVLPATDKADKSPSVSSVGSSHTHSQKFDRRCARVVRQLQAQPELRVAFDALNAPLKPESGEAVSVVVAVRTAVAGIVSAEFLVPRERFDFLLFAKALEETARRPS